MGTVEPGGSRVDTYGYDQAGNTTGRTLAGVSQGLDYDVEGRASRVTEADGRVSAFVYDAAGSRLVKREPGAVTLFLPGMELRLDTATRVVSGTRFYAHGDTVVATRQGASTLTWKIADHQQTATVAVAEATLAVSTRRQDPYGNTRGTTPGTWPDTKTFVGGTTDTTTGLTRVGARDYDPTTGRFTTVDPIMDMADPQQWNAYTYANGSPITFSDPTGLWCDGCNSGGGWPTEHGYIPSKINVEGRQVADVSKPGGQGLSKRHFDHQARPHKGSEHLLEHIPGYNDPVCSTFCAIVGGVFVGLVVAAACGTSPLGIIVCGAIAGAASGAVTEGAQGRDPARGAFAGALFGAALGNVARAIQASAVQLGVSGSRASTPGSSGAPARTGSLSITGSQYSSSELNVAKHLANHGNNVVLRDPTGVHGARTSDLLVNNVRYDVYTPVSTNVRSILGRVAQKHSQVRGGGVIVDLSKSGLSSADFGNALARVNGIIKSWQEPGTPMSDVIFYGG